MTLTLTRDEEKFELDERLPVLPLRDVVIFPYMVIPLLVGRAASLAAVEAALAGDRWIFLVAQRTADTQDPAAADLFRVGVAGRVLQVARLPNGTTKVLVEGVARAKVTRYAPTEKVLRAIITPFALEEPAGGADERAMARRVVTEMASPGSSWSETGREAALAAISVDRSAAQHVMLYAGDQAYTYSAFLGELQAGEHELRLERNVRYSAPGSALKVLAVHFQEVAPEDPYWAALAHAPILYARANTIGRFDDIPLLLYCERLVEKGQAWLQYTMIFSNEDGGTSTRALMARWGRTTDVEYIYRAWLDQQGNVERATIQARDHKEVAFRGRREGPHPVLIPSTDNNMVSDQGSSPIRYQIPPVVMDLTAHSREANHG